MQEVDKTTKAGHCSVSCCIFTDHSLLDCYNQDLKNVSTNRYTDTVQAKDMYRIKIYVK